MFLNKNDIFEEKIQEIPIDAYFPEFNGEVGSYEAGLKFIYDEYILMTTKLISLHEFRKNLSSIWKTAKKKNEVYIVMVHSKPVLEVRPVKK